MINHKSRALGFFVFLLTATFSAFGQPSSIAADPKAIALADNVRFTVLTPELIRLEWSAEGKFEDRASLVFVNRRLPIPTFSVKSEGHVVTVETEKLRLTYRKSSGKFAGDNLQIEFMIAGTKRVWHPGMEDTGNLFGTIRTLDGVKGSIKLDRGLISRDGWVLIDDSTTPLFDNSDWPWAMPRETADRQDFYFFGYGHDYKKALGDFTKIAGKIPMPPKYIFGSWWSRYWSYTDEEIKDLVRQYKTYNVPLDVLVVDMDWHLTFDLRWGKAKRDQAGQSLGWTGHTWDNVLFPDPQGFLQWCKNEGLKVTLNLHPASGIQPHEEVYPQIASAMGIDPSSQKYVPFDITNKKFAENYFNIVLRPLERRGVDFWWIDWQQWDTTRLPGLNPTWWLNYAFYTDMQRQNKQRPVILARWGGLGSHRHQIGFSGDVLTDWSSLAFQTYFTSTAANVGFGYWSHDIGGHIPGTVSPELYTRWIQWGIFSPVLRTHTTKNAEAERRIWAYPYEYFSAMKEAFLLRYSLLPYIYTESRKAYDTGISLCRPLYYDYPDLEEAYGFKEEYMFGDNLMAAPVASPISPDTLLASKKIWIPPGDWTEWFSGRTFKGPLSVDRSFSLHEIPVYVKAGSIIPLQLQMKSSSKTSLDPLILAIFAGDSGSTRVYEDAGNSLGYKKGEFAETPVSFRKTDDRTLSIRISPVEGRYPGMLDARGYEVRLVSTLPPQSVLCNGRKLKNSQEAALSSWRYDGNKLTTIISLPKFGVRQRVEVVVKLSGTSNTALVRGIPEKLARLQSAMNILNGLWPKDWSPSDLVEAVQTGHRITIHPLTAERELQKLERIMRELPGRIQLLEGDSLVIRRALNHLSSVKE